MKNRSTKLRFFIPLVSTNPWLYTIGMNSHLKVIVGDRETKVDYVVDGQTIVSHMHPVGLKMIELEGMNMIAGSKLVDGIMYALEFVSLHDRIPTDVRLITPRYSTWIGETIENASYAQFYTNGVPVRVTLVDTHDPSISYAGHSKTIFSFKV